MLPVVYDRRMAGNSRVFAPASGAFVLAQSASGPALKFHNRGMRGLEEAQEDYVGVGAHDHASLPRTRVPVIHATWPGSCLMSPSDCKYETAQRRVDSAR
jgi:hypothetical protein